MSRRELPQIPTIIASYLPASAPISSVPSSLRGTVCATRSRPFLYFIHRLHLLSPRQGHWFSNSALSSLHDNILSPDQAFPSACKYAIMSLIQKKSFPHLDLISPSSFYPTFLPPLLQNSSKELSTIPLSSHSSSRIHFLIQFQDKILWFSSSPTGHFVWGSFAFLPLLPDLLL